jgi:hypothetical protein
MTYLEQRQQLKLTGKAIEKVTKVMPKDVKVKKEIAKVSPKMKLDEWFLSTRQKLTGKCQCGCGENSSKSDNLYFKHSCCHIFPKSKFKSVATHPLNFVERAFWGGCHSVMDDTSIKRWVNMADWQDIKHKFAILSTHLTPTEKANKFYRLLEELVLNN